MDCNTRVDECVDSELDPRIQVELEKLNNATDEINKLETELEEANATFRLLLNESTRRLKVLSKKLGSCIEQARPYYEALEVARQAQLECQRAAVQFQRANEIHQAAKETVALAEERFLSKQHEWQFDNAWQEMLNHATIKVMDAENQKSESGREHHRRATLFNAAEQKVQQLEQQLRRKIIKSRPYFEEKALCQEQLAAQKERVEFLQKAVADVKQRYAASLRALEQISDEIHWKRGDSMGPREPGVGAESLVEMCETSHSTEITSKAYIQSDRNSEGFLVHYDATKTDDLCNSSNTFISNYELELDRCDITSLGSQSIGTSSAVSEKDDNEQLDEIDNEEDIEVLKQQVRELAVRPIEGGDGSCNLQWNSELNQIVSKLDNLLQERELEEQSSGQGVGDSI